MLARAPHFPGVLSRALRSFSVTNSANLHEFEAYVDTNALLKPFGRRRKRKSARGDKYPASQDALPVVDDFDLLPNEKFMAPNQVHEPYIYSTS